MFNWFKNKIKRIEKFGNVSVESGQLYLGDPCWKSKKDKKIYGVELSGWGGDGTFNVFTERTSLESPHLVSRIIIDMDGSYERERK